MVAVIGFMVLCRTGIRPPKCGGRIPPLWRRGLELSISVRQAGARGPGECETHVAIPFQAAADESPGFATIRAEADSVSETQTDEWLKVAGFSESGALAKSPAMRTFEELNDRRTPFLAGSLCSACERRTTGLGESGDFVGFSAECQNPL